MSYKEILCILLMPLDYQNTIIYKIVSKDLNIKECYVGHTTNFNRRKNEHKNSCKKGDNKKVYRFIRENGGINNFDIVIIERFPCNDRNEAGSKERYWYEQLNSSLNTIIPYRNEEHIKEYNKVYRENNKESITKAKQIYAESNKDAIKFKQKLYYDNNKESLLEQKKKYRKNNIEKIKKINKESYEKCKESILENKRKYYIENKDKIEEHQKIKHSCECGGEYTTQNKSKHCKTIKHQEYIKKISN